MPTFLNIGMTTFSPPQLSVMAVLAIPIAPALDICITVKYVLSAYGRATQVQAERGGWADNT